MFAKPSLQTTLEIAEERFEKRLAQLDAKIAEVKAELIKWMFIFWAGHTVAVVGIVFTVVKYLK